MFGGILPFFTRDLKAMATVGRENKERIELNMASNMIQSLRTEIKRSWRMWQNNNKKSKKEVILWDQEIYSERNFVI